MFLEQCKYNVEEKKMPQYITDNIELFSDSNRNDCNKENSDKENFD